MKKVTLLLSAIILSIGFSFATVNNNENGDKKNDVKAEKAEINGFVSDAASSEVLAGVIVEFEGIDQVVYSDLAGNFKVSDIKPGVYNVKAKYISYKDAVMQKVEVKAGENNSMEIKLLAE